MAYTRPQSAGKAQVEKKCELCLPGECDTKIQYKCVQCDKYMCEKCYRVHLKVKTAIKHEIINLWPSQTNQDTVTGLVTENILCELHAKRFCTKYCYSCTELVCQYCIDKTHKEHQIEEINEGCTLDILKIQGRLSKELWFCENESKQVKASFNTFCSSYDNARIQIDNKEKELKKAIKEYANQLRAKIETEIKNVEKYKTTSETKIKDIKQILVEKESELKRAKKSNNADTIIKVVRNINNNLPILHFHHLPQEICDFIPGDFYMSELFGSLQTKQIPQVQYNINLEVMKNYTTELNCIYKLLTLDNVSTWISNFEVPTMRQIILDDKIRNLRCISKAVSDMSMTSNNDVLLTFSFSDNVSLLDTKTGEIKPFLSASPLHPCCIHVMKDDIIGLGVIEEGGTYNLTDKSCRSVILFEKDGKIKQDFKYDKHKERLFTFPYRITSNINNDILLIDRTSVYDGRVVVFDRDEHIKWIYQGNPHVNSGDKHFKPMDIVTTSVGHVIVCDFYRHALHILSQMGDPLKCKIMEDVGIVYPVSMDINTSGQLWVGCHSGNSAQFDAKLHILKFVP